MGALSTAGTLTSVCPNCGAVFTDPDLTECPNDGAKLASERSPQTLVDRVVGGRYRIVSRLGEGGMGTVYVAEHALSQRRVALKIIRPELESSQVARERFLRECRALERVQSPHVVQVLEAGESAAGEIYLVMELLEGETLGARIEAHGALPPAEALAIASQVCSALRAAHAKDVVHRDLKPENVFLCADGTVRVLDFGIARLLHGDTRDDHADARKLTRTGTIVGTPAYISPEGAAGEEVGPAGDLYSFGVMLFEALTGQLPFSETRPVLLMGMHMKDAPPSLRDVRPDLAFPRTLVSLVDRLLAKRPADRPASAEAVLETLEAARAELLAPPALHTRELGVMPSRPRRTSPFVWIGLTGLALVAALAGVAVALWPDRDVRATTLPSADPPSLSAAPQPSVEPTAEPFEPAVTAPPPAPIAPPVVEEPPELSEPEAPPRATKSRASRPRRDAPRRRDLVRDYF